MSTLILGAGHSQIRHIAVGKDQVAGTFPEHAVKLDINPRCEPDVLFDLERLSDDQLPFEDHTFTEIHAYEVLEHFGRQGDFRGFFRQFYEFWRVLEPDGFFCGSVPLPDSVWAWGDPGHVRVLPLEVFTFLDQTQCENQLGNTTMTDYREWWNGDFRPVWQEKQNGTQMFALQAIKEVRSGDDQDQ
jgi:SAM-dependent methyltransferase